MTIERDKMSLQLSEIGGAQDFGDEIQLEEDSGALNSILNNQGMCLMHD